MASTPRCSCYNWARDPYLVLGIEETTLTITVVTQAEPGREGLTVHYLTEHEDLWYNNQSYVGKILVDALPSTPYEGQLQLELPPKPSKEA